MLWPWLVSVVSLYGVWLFTARRFTPQLAIGIVAILASVVPTWSTIGFFGEQMNVRMAVSILALISYCFHPKATFPLRLGVLDGAMIGLVCIHLISDVENTGWSFIIPARIYGEWFVPYVMGRLALTDISNLSKLAKVGCMVALILACGAVVEATSGAHPWDLFWGPPPEDPARVAYRFDFLRSWGCCGHPIYFAVLQLSLFPWLLRSWNLRAVTFSQLLSKIVPFIGIVGIVATISRAPIIAAVCVVIGAAGLSSTRLRWALIGLTIVFVPLGLLEQKLVMDTIHAFGEESADSYRNKIIIVDGKEVPFTSALARMYLFKVYGRAAYRAGLIGFGTQSVTQFPVNVPVGPEDVTALSQVRSIDNQYLLLVLRFGWLGGGLFAASVILAVVSWFQRARYENSSDRKTCFYFGMTVLAMGGVLLTVWMPEDIGYPLLFLMGGASFWYPLDSSMKQWRDDRSNRPFLKG